MKLNPFRLCIYPKDVSLVTGKTERCSRKLLAKIRQSLGKQPHQTATIVEFCNYMGLKMDDVLRILGWDQPAKAARVVTLDY